MSTADRELARSEERFRLLVESVVDYAIFVLDPDGVIQTWNPGAERLKGYSEDEIVGHHYSIFYPEELREQNLPDRLLAEAEANGSVQHSGWRVRQDGTRFWASVVITALHEDDGSLAGFAKVTRDMTDSHRAEQAREEALEQERQAVAHLEEVDRWRRDFVGSIAHDLRSPVTAILGFTRILLEEPLDGQEQAAFLARVLSNARTLEDLIQHLRTFLRLEAGEIELTRERFPLAELVHELVADMEPVLTGHPVTIEVGDATVVADRTGVERILRNLLQNAAEHTPAGTEVVVRARDRGEVVEVEVVDAGPGMDPELTGRVLARFERGAGQGTGLGLSIAKQYVELHGGEVTLESDPGTGTRFVFTLPAG